MISQSERSLCFGAGNQTVLFFKSRNDKTEMVSKGQLSKYTIEDETAYHEYMFKSKQKRSFLNLLFFISKT